MKSVTSKSGGKAKTVLSRTAAEAQSAIPVPLEVVSLEAHERLALEECEQILRRGLATFFEVGRALLTIREKKLYRSSHATFDTYCRDRWGMSRIHAWRLIGAAERLQLLPPEDGVRKPNSEYQIRPFLKLEPAAFPKAWSEAIARVKDGNITAALLQTVVAEITPKKGAKSSPKDRHTSPVFSDRCLPGQVLAMLQELKRRTEKAETSQALEVIDRIERLLFGG